MMNRAAEILEAGNAEIGRLMTLEMGKTFRSAADEAVKCAWACRYYAENAERFLADEVVENHRQPQLRDLSADGRDPGGDAVEFPVLAGVSIHRAGLDGWQRRMVETRLERASVRAEGCCSRA
jgi:acyl-CoA reductase-like NAD-dependent aldehyde dehydrogenase